MKWNYRKSSQRNEAESSGSGIVSQKDSLMDHVENRQMFNYLAPYYDKTNRILSLGLDRSWRKKAVSKLVTPSVKLVLDVGAGTGDIGLNIARHNAGITVVGIDTSMEMMRVGGTKTKKMDVGNKSLFCSSNVLNLCFADKTFDGAITAFCIRNVEDRSSALAEIFRVLKSGSKFVIVELTQPQGFFMKPLFTIYSGLVTPTVTHFLSSVSAYDYLSESMADFPSPSVFTLLLEKTGFKNITHFHLTFGIVTIYESIKP